MTSARNHLGPKPKLWQKRTREAPLCRSSGADFRKVLASEEELYVNLTRWSLVLGESPDLELYARLHCQREEVSSEIVRFAEFCRSRPPAPRERLDGRPGRHVRLFRLSQRLI